MEKEKEKKIKLLLTKLQSPLEYEYICLHILKCNTFECLEILQTLTEEGIIEKENKTYKLKNKK